MTVQFQMIAEDRDSDWHHPDVTRMVVRDLRDSDDFDGIPCPYTPKSLISEMIGRLGDVSGRRALVLYTLEMAIALKEAGCEDVTVATRTENELTGQLASDIGCRYMLLPGGTSTEESVLAIAPDMKFDIVIGNPPYQAVGRTGNPIWQDFVQSGLNILRGGGRFAMIHPPAWRSVGRTNSRAMAEVRETLKRLDIEWLSMTSMDDCAKFFKGKTIPFDVYIARNSNTPKFQTEVVGTNGVKFHACIKDMEFIPSFQCDDLDRVLAIEGEERVNFIRSRTAYGSEKTWINKEKAHDFRYPCVWSVSQNANLRGENGGKLTLYYSCKIQEDDDGNAVHFGVPKVIFGVWNRAGFPYVDREGRYGMCEHAGAISDDVANLDAIARVMDGSRFRKMMDAARFNTEDWNRHVIKLFRKDFWKEFVDDDGHLVDEAGNRIDRKGDILE